jgi:UDP-N-acetylglucosamine 1-carboxyvinyltransferase
MSAYESIDFRITGGQKLAGTIATNTSKNGAVNLLCAAMLNRGRTTLRGIPQIEEVHRYVEVIESLGAKATWQDKNTLTIQTPAEPDFAHLNFDVAAKIRSFTFLGALIHAGRHFSFPNPGGCKMGERTIAAHKYGLEKLGVKIETLEETYEITPGTLHPSEVVLYESSDTGAINVMLAAAKIPGKTTVKMAPPNYQVQEVCFLLEKFGVQIEGIGTTTLVVHGVKEIDLSIEHDNSEDPIESMFFVTSAILTDSALEVTRCPAEFIELELEKLRHMGLQFEMSPKYPAKNGRTMLADIKVSPSKLIALEEKIHTQPFPGLQNDNLPYFVPIATKARGRTFIHDWMWENRAIYYTELNRLGADVTLMDPYRALIEGPTPLKGAQIVCPPALRPSAIILIAMLGAEGVSTLRNVYSIRRGYAEIAERLNLLGAQIEVLNS